MPNVGQRLRRRASSVCTRCTFLPEYCLSAARYRPTSANAQTFYLQVRRAAAAATGTARQFVYRLQVTLRK